MLILTLLNVRLRLKLLYLMPNSCISFNADFLVGKKLQLPSFVDCLKERGTVHMLTIGRDAAIEVQVCPCKELQVLVCVPCT